MHKFVLNIFYFLRSLLHFFKILFVFSILMLLFYWVENLTHANWAWLNFIKPFLDFVLSISSKINSGSIDLLGAVFEYKFGIALIIYIILFYSMNFLRFLVDLFEDVYEKSYSLCKKTEENLLNKSLQRSVEKEEKKIKKYSILIKTTLKKKFSHKELNINIAEQNNLMNKFIIEKLSVTPKNFEDGFLYDFYDFDEIDAVLDVMFKVLKSSAPLDYAICVQIGNDVLKLKKLVDLKYYGKITMLAETSYRYRYNKTHRYKTSQVGLFQNGNNTIEVHEFKEIL